MDRFLLFETLASQVVFQYTAMTIVIGGIVVVADLADPCGPQTLPESLPRALARTRTTATAVTVPRLSSMIAEQRTRPSDLSALQAILVSGSPLSHDRHHEAQAVLGPVVFHGYGQTEAGMIAMGTPADPPGTVGFPSDTVNLEIRDPRGALVPEGGEGELFVRTPGQSRGYWADPELTAEVYVDGWIRTRDLGLLDDDGRLRITGRARDVVIVDAAVHYIGPIERAVAEHPDVVEAYVVAVPDETTGEAVHAFVVAADGREPDPGEVRALVVDRLGPACAPRRVTTIAAPPVGPSGKPDKLQLFHQALAEARSPMTSRSSGSATSTSASSTGPR
jgi:acyl-coenzyme A synthetase/AMP-(fatty) acid ligase